MKKIIILFIVFLLMSDVPDLFASGKKGKSNKNQVIIKGRSKTTEKYAIENFQGIKFSDSDTKNYFYPYTDRYSLKSRIRYINKRMFIKGVSRLDLDKLFPPWYGL